MSNEQELATRQDFADLQQGHWGLHNKWRVCGNEGTFTANGGQGDDSSVTYDCFDGSANNPRPYGVSEERCMWWMSDYACGSDYSGGSVAASNYRTLVRHCASVDNERGRKEDEPTFWQTFHGGHGTFAIAFHVDKTPKEVFEMLAALDGYPVCDESDLSELELERECDAWESWARDDYRRALEKEFEGDASEVTEDDLFEHFQEWSEESGTYWEHNNEGPWVSIERIVAACTEAPPGFVAEGGPDMPPQRPLYAALSPSRMASKPVCSKRPNRH